MNKLNKHVYSVSHVTRYIKTMLEEDILLDGIWIEGEISNCHPHSSGHLYLTLKDARSALTCVMFKSSASKLKFQPENGMKVLVYGYFSLYEKTGQYQMYLENMEPAGHGAVYLAYRQLKERLLKEGYFDPAKKLPLPYFPRTVALITSPEGAAVQDMIQVISRRNKAIKIVVVPVPVQGEKAPGEIVNAIKLVHQWGKADVIIVGRGGGSTEDLWAFNDEAVIRAAYDAKIPLVSAVGHETDISLLDEVADLRAPTPSAAAELVAPLLSTVEETLQYMCQRLYASMASGINDKKQQLDKALHHRALARPLNMLYQKQLDLENILKDLYLAMGKEINKNKNKLSSSWDVLNSISPLSVLERGYVAVTDTKGNTLAGAGDIKNDMRICLYFYDGKIQARLSEVTREGHSGEKETERGEIPQQD